MGSIRDFVQNYLTKLYVPSIEWNDIIEIVIIAFVLYNILAWIKNTKAWTLLKGIIFICMFAIVAYILNLKTILWIAGKTAGVGIIALVIIFQPELRRALEQLGRKKFIFGTLSFGSAADRGSRFSSKTVDELVRAAFEMGEVKTGALIVIEQDINLEEYIRTGIELDALITSQLLINIFEHNTPLHDGAVIVRGDRIVSATCYLPLSDSVTISKALGTRHRAGLGISEATDSLTIIVSEETGMVSIAKDGNIIRNVDKSTLKNSLEKIRNNTVETNVNTLTKLKGILKNEGKDI